MEFTIIAASVFLGGLIGGVLGAYLFKPEQPKPAPAPTREQQLLKEIADNLKHLETIAHLQRLSLGGKSPVNLDWSKYQTSSK